MKISSIVLKEDILISILTEVKKLLKNQI